METLISNVTVVTGNERNDILFGAYLGIDDGKISYLDKTAPKEQPATIIDGTGMVAIPGLINCHTHLPDTALRCVSDDASRQEALERQLYLTDKLDHKAVKAAAMLGIAECLRFGITSVSDLSSFPEAVLEAADEIGIKANVALGAYRFTDTSEDYDFDKDPMGVLAQRLAKEYHGKDNGRLKVDAGLEAEYISNHPLWESLAGWASQENLGLQLHLSESVAEREECEDRTGLSPTEVLNAHNLFCVPTCAAGVAGLSQEEMQLLGKKKATGVITPMANAKQGLAQADVLAMVKSGMNVALGTGGASQCGNLDMFEVLRYTALQSRQATGKPEGMPAQAVMMMATFCGATAQGRQETCGMLKVGMDADIALVDFTAPHLIPSHDILSTLVFSAKGSDVAMTMVGGKILYRSGVFTTMDLNQVVSSLMEYTIPRMMDKKE